ncbi:MAG: YidH family protein [Alphaproteobacteria bacterium]
MITNYTDHAANERTYLAWVRTGVTVLVLGFFVERFEMFIQMSGAENNEAAIEPAGVLDVSMLAVFLVALGLLVIVFSTGHYVRINRAIDRQETMQFRDLTLPLVMSGLLFVFGVLLLLWLVRII